MPYGTFYADMFLVAKSAIIPRIPDVANNTTAPTIKPVADFLNSAFSFGAADIYLIAT